MEGGLIMFFHCPCPWWRRGISIEEAAIEALFGAGRFGFQTVEHFLIEQHLGAFGHRTFFDDIVDSIQHRVSGDFSFAEPIQRLHFFREALDRGRQTRPLLIEIFRLPVQDVSKQAGRLVIEIVPGGHDVVMLLDGRSIELIPLNGSASRTGRSMNQHGQLTNPCAGLFLHGVNDQFRVMGLPQFVGEALHFPMRLLRVIRDAKIHIKRIGAIAERKQNSPKGEAIFAAGHGDENAIFESEHPLGLHGSCHLLVHEPIKAELAERGVVPGKADYRFGFTLRTIHIIRMLKMDPNCVLGLSPSST